MDLSDLIPRLPESPRQRKLRERHERMERLRGGPPPAAEALRKAMGWQQQMREEGIRRADIARRERLTRARVTQIMSLLTLPEDVKVTLLAIDKGQPSWSIREALRLVG